MENFLDLLVLLWTGIKIPLFILFLAYMIERAVELFFGLAFDMPFFPVAWKKYKPVLAYVGFAVGIAGAFVYKLDFMAEMGKLLEIPIVTNGFGIFLTGVMTGGGSAIVHEIIKKFFLKPKP